MPIDIRLVGTLLFVLSKGERRTGMAGRLLTVLRSLLNRSKAERELDEELRYHIEQQVEQNVRLGMSREAAGEEARRTFGGVEQAKERSRDLRGGRWLEELWRDLRFGARM